MKLLGIEIGAAPEERGTLGRLLDQNKALRDIFAAEPKLARKLSRLQKWQSSRLLRSHADLHANPRYRLAVEFFFNELYGADARQRDVDAVAESGLDTRPAGGSSPRVHRLRHVARPQA